MEFGDEAIWDPVCCICDNGGILLRCEGVCMRSFHATQQDTCISLGLTPAEVEAIPIFECRNCQDKQHQCFSCGQLGSSDETFDTEVFQCAVETCGYFYHPQCVAQQLRQFNGHATKDLQNEIIAGEPFVCPHHLCVRCGLPEDKTNFQLQMAVCRRCPKAYHRGCLPWEIVLDSNEEEVAPVRAWDYLLPDRIMMYCLDHEIADELGYPEPYIQFPGN